MSDMRMRAAFLSVVAVLLLTVVASPADATSKQQLTAKALSLSNMPAGWTVDPPTGAGATASGCLHTIKLTGKHDVKEFVQFHNGTAPVLGEALEAGPSAANRLKAMSSTFSRRKRSL